jgi:transposase
MLAYKCEWYGKELVLVNPAYTSQTCSHCGENTGKKPLRIRTFDCPHCHTTGIDRDVNAAINILNKALAQRYRNWPRLIGETAVALDFQRGKSALFPEARSFMPE